MIAYCIECGKMVASETTNGHYFLDFCDFSGGLAFTPQPEFNIDEWLETAEPPTDEEMAILDAEAELWTE